MNQFSNAMHPTWQVREATPADADSLENCMQSAYAVYQPRMGGMRLPPMDADYSSEIRIYPAWVAASGNSVLGGLIMSFDNGQATIANISVHPDFQGQGIGSSLMKFAETKARENDFAELSLATHVLLEENIAMYRHLGWIEINRDEFRVYMKKVL